MTGNDWHSGRLARGSDPTQSRTFIRHSASYDISCNTHTCDPEAHTETQRSVEVGLSSRPGSCIWRGGRFSLCDSAMTGGPLGQVPASASPQEVSVHPCVQGCPRAQGSELPCPRWRVGPGPMRCRACPSWRPSWPLQDLSSPLSGSLGGAMCVPLSLLRVA